MAVFTMSGAKLYIGGSLASKQTDFIASDFSGVTWQEVGGVGNIGSFGDQANYGTYNILGTRRGVPFLTTLGGSSTTIQFAMDETDTGQAAIRTAGSNPGTFYAVKIEFDNAEGGTKGYVMFIANFSPMSYDGGGNESALTWTASMAIGSNVVHVDRVPA